MNTTGLFNDTRSGALGLRSRTPGSTPQTTILVHPGDVLADPDMTAAEKRSLLASWASDARAVVNSPGLRQLDSGAVISVDEILEAIKALGAADADDATARRRAAKLLPFVQTGHRHGRKQRKKILWRNGSDDDDPPSAPAVAAIPRRMPKLSLHGSLAGLVPAA